MFINVKVSTRKYVFFIVLLSRIDLVVGRRSARVCRRSVGLLSASVGTRPVRCDPFVLQSISPRPCAVKELFHKIKSVSISTVGTSKKYMYINNICNRTANLKMNAPPRVYGHTLKQKYSGRPFIFLNTRRLYQLYSFTVLFSTQKKFISSLFPQ